MHPILARRLLTCLPELRAERDQLRRDLDALDAAIREIEPDAPTAVVPAPDIDDLSAYVEKSRTGPGGRVAFSHDHPRPQRLRAGTGEVEHLYVGGDAVSANRHRKLGVPWQGSLPHLAGAWLTEAECDAVYAEKRLRSAERRRAERATPTPTPANTPPSDGSVVVTDPDVLAAARRFNLGRDDGAGRRLTPAESMQAHAHARSR